MRHRVGMTDMAALMAGTEADIERVTTSAMREGTELLKADWRGQIETAGLGPRLARTVRGKTFPEGASSLDPASWVWTKAPKLMDAFDRGPTILPTDGRFYLAIPSTKVPRRGRRRMTPVEVEASFNQDLIIRRGGNGSLLAFVDVLAARSGRGYRPPTKRRLAQGRKRRLVLMFVLVRSVKVRKRLDIDALADRAASRWPGLLSKHWASMPDRTAPLKGG